MSHVDAVASRPTQDERTLALLAHILQIMAWWLAPLIILLVRRDSRFVAFHAMQALLLQLAYCAVIVMFIFCWFVIAIFSSMLPPSHMPSPFPFLLFPLFPLGWVAPWVTVSVMGIVYGIKANAGEWAEYPVLGKLARKILHMGPGAA